MQRILITLGMMFQPPAGNLIVAVLIKPRRLVHVVLPQVHPVRLRMEHFQLDLLDPAAVPERLVLPLDEAYHGLQVQLRKL